MQNLVVLLLKESKLEAQAINMQKLQEAKRAKKKADDSLLPRLRTSYI